MSTRILAKRAFLRRDPSENRCRPIDKRRTRYYNTSKMNDSKKNDKGAIHVSLGIEFSRKLALAYNAVCKPLCRELGLSKTAFDILMFLGNNPTYKTARDVVELRCLKANLVSVNVDRLAQEGYLVRRQAAGDRRKTELLCTDKAQPVIARGRQLQSAFFQRLFADMDDGARHAFFAAMEIMDQNLNAILEAEE